MTSPHRPAETTSATAAPASRCWTLHGSAGAVDVQVTARDDDILSEVLPALAAALGGRVDGLWSGTSRLPDRLPMSADELRHGAVLGLDRPGPRGMDEPPTSAVDLRVAGGPEAGRTVPLVHGRHVVGRGAGAGIRLEDPDVSRRHLEVTVGGGSVSVRDLGSTNGSRLGAVDLDETPVPWPNGVVLRLGGSALVLSGPSGTAAVLEPGSAGRRRVRIPTRITTPPVEVEIEMPAVASPPPARRMAWAAVALPAVGGVLLATLLRTPTFLFFALLSPVVALGTWWSERWSGRRAGRRDAARCAADLAATLARVETAVDTFVRATAERFPDLAALATAAHRRRSVLWGRRAADEDALIVRLGTGPGATAVVQRHQDGRRVPVVIDHLPVTLDLRRTGGLAVSGPRERALGVLRSLAGQLSVLHAPGTVDVLLLVDPAQLRDWRWTRWLPHLACGGVTLLDGGPHSSRGEEQVRAALAARVDRARGDAADRTPVASWQVVVVDCPLSAVTAAALRDARAGGVVVLALAGSGEPAPAPVDAHLRLCGETGDHGHLRQAGSADRHEVTVDRLGADMAAELARSLAGLEPATSRTALPARIRLLDLAHSGAPLEEAVLGWSRARNRLVAPLGAGADGTVAVDLCRHGPHALVAGTTGSGKSELLQSLIAGLALGHPPDRCSFLLVDYKGGAAFAEAAGLPHTVGLLTDLDGQTTVRALRSLTAELVRREQLLARCGAADIAALPDEVDLARLVIVVDEFATLAEELPEFVPGLVGIAQRGRSLGVHLVLATQRPGGIVSPEIRANCTLRICLRTTDEADSRDVLNTPAAASLPTDRPGRAYVRSGTGAPVLVQVARVSQPPSGADENRPRAQLWSWPAPLVAEDRPTPDGATDLSRVAQVLAGLAAGQGVPLPHRPWQPPLPDRVSAAHLAAASSVPEELVIGLLDQPDRQTQQPLTLDLRTGGGWLAVGGPRSGRTTLLRSVLRQAAGRCGPDRVHVHVIDLGGGSLAAEADDLPHSGTAIGRLDALRTVRLVDRLAREVAHRRAEGTAPADAPLLLVLVDGVEHLTALLDDGEPGRGSATFLQLVRDGAAAGLTCVLTGDRAVPGGRLAAVASRRLVLPLVDRADYAVAGVPMSAVPSARPPGRAIVGEEALECQIALADPVVPRSAPPGRLLPIRVVELDPDPALPLPVPGARAAALRLPVGPGGDEGEPLFVDLARTGGLLVVGPPGSGRSSALRAFAAHLTAAGVPVLRVGSSRREDCDPGDSPRAAASDTATVTSWIHGLGGGFGVVCADDVGAPAETPAVLAIAPDAPVAVLAAGGAGQFSAHFQGSVSALRRSRSGLLLCPTAPEADVLGLRLPRTPVPVRPGSGWLVTSGAWRRVQVARHRSGPVAP